MDLEIQFLYLKGAFMAIIANTGTLSRLTTETEWREDRYIIMGTPVFLLAVKFYRDVQTQTYTASCDGSSMPADQIAPGGLWARTGKELVRENGFFWTYSETWTLTGVWTQSSVTTV